MTLYIWSCLPFDDMGVQGSNECVDVLAPRPCWYAKLLGGNSKTCGGLTAYTLVKEEPSHEEEMD